MTHEEPELGTLTDSRQRRMSSIEGVRREKGASRRGSALRGPARGEGGAGLPHEGITEPTCLCADDHAARFAAPYRLTCPFVGDSIATGSLQALAVMRAIVCGAANDGAALTVLAVSRWLPRGDVTPARRCVTMGGGSPSGISKARVIGNSLRLPAWRALGLSWFSR